MSSFFSSLRSDAIPAFAAATQRARSNCLTTTKIENMNDENAVIFDEFGAFETINTQQYVIETNHEENESETDSDIEDDEEIDEEIRRFTQQMQNRNLPTQKNSPGMQSKQVETLNGGAQESREQKTSPHDSGHARNATAPLSNAALSRMRYYRKLVPTSNYRNTSPKSEPHPSTHLSTASPSRDGHFFPSSHSASSIAFHHSTRSAPITIPTKKLSPINSDSSHRFRGADIHPRITADSSFILPAASYLPSALQKCFVPTSDKYDDENDNHNIIKGRTMKEKLLNQKEESGKHSNEKDDEGGFQFEMDM